MTDALSPYEEGRQACAEGLDPCQNPYKPFCADDDEYDWNRGWDDADRERLKRQLAECEMRRANRASIQNAKLMFNTLMKVMG